MRDVAEYRKKRQSVSKYEYISTENMLQHYMGITPYADSSNIEGIEYCVGDTLIGNIRPYLKKVWFATFDGACSADVLALKPNYINPEFLYDIIAQDGFIEYVMSGVKGSKMPRGDKSHILDYETALPSLAEQEKIAYFLRLLSTRIQKLQLLIDSLKKYKRGLLYTIFSDDNNWDRVRLGDICSIKTGKLDANAMEDNGAYPFFTCAREHYAINTYAFDCDALLISGNGANVGYIHHYCGKFNAYQRTYVLSNFTANIIYIQYYLETRLAERIEAEKKAGNTPYIVLSTLSDMEISLPALAQQNKIAVLMSYCDKHIQNEESHLEYLEILKKSLLRNLFI